MTDPIGTPAMQRSQPTRKQAALLLMAGRVVGSLLTVVTAGVLARWWSESEYGEYRQIWLAFQAMSPFVTLGVPAGLTYFLPQIDRGHQKAAVAQAAVLLAGSGALISLATIGWSGLLGGTDGGGGLPAAAAFALYPIFALPLLVADTWLVAVQRSRTAAWFTIQTAVVQAAAAIVPVVAGCGVAVVMGSLTLATLVRFLIVLSLYRSEYRGVAAAWNPEFPRQLLRYTLPLGLAGVVGSFNLLLDKLFVAWWQPPAEFAIYSNGATELPVIGIVSGSVAAVLAPEFVRLFQAGRRREMVDLWSSSIRTTAMLVFPLTAAMLLFAPDAVTILYSEKYLASVPVFRIYLLILPLRITVHGSLLLAAGHSRTVFSSSVVGLGLAAVLLGMLVPWCGVPGAAAAMVLSVYGVAAMLLFSSAKLIGVSWRRVFPWRDLALTLAASAAGAATAAVFTHQLAAGWVRLVLGLAVTGGVCLVIQACVRRSRSDLVAVVAAVTGRSVGRCKAA